ncbi:MAG: 1-(5-phosphoribosyl)-5-[Clostridia bacterium]|nr:1-(5-phosphoribosyl)-5-[(5-phosphoribosylamino)methylideneamino]imidazole-4-carboxamide isomerase [Clostridia bacterium]
MKIFPAIDLYGGKAVRLFKGDYDKMTVYSDEPAEVAREFARLGAKFVHVVDLEGARDGETPNFDTVLRIKNASGAFVEIGGGIRTEETVEKYLAAGIDRVILGTAAIEDSDFLRSCLDKYGEMIAVGADLKDGFVAVRGWKEVTSVTADDFFEMLSEYGVKNVICTDISKDGAMQGTNRTLYKELSDKYDIDITASGGVSTLDDVKALAAMGLYGAIIGKAYYTGAIDIREAIEVANDN